MKEKLIKITATALLIASTAANAKAEWTIKIFEGAVLTDINESGQVLGYYPGTDSHFITGPNGEGIIKTMEFSGAVDAINDLGQAAGTINTGSHYHAFITGPNGEGITVLNGLDSSNSNAYDINNSGQVTGIFDTTGGYKHAFITGPNGIGITDLGTLGGKNSYASAINDSGQVVGTSETLDSIGHSHAFITSPNGVGMTDLGTLSGTGSNALDVNDDGRAVGYTFGINPVIFLPNTNPFITGANGENMSDISAVPVDIFYSIASMHINNQGQTLINIAGDCIAYACGQSLLFDNGIVTNINTILIETNPGTAWSAFASGINDNGQIIGVDSYGASSGIYRSFILTPITATPAPEPSTYAMLLAGLGLMVFMAGRKQS